MEKNFVARAGINISASPAKVWEALVNPEAIRQFMFGTNVVTDWKTGSPIIWKGEWQGKAYQDHGVILNMDPEHRLEYSHFSPLSGQPDVPENYHNVRIELSGAGRQTNVTLTQDNNASEEERQHSQNNWQMMLESLKKYIEAMQKE